MVAPRHSGHAAADGRKATPQAGVEIRLAPSWRRAQTRNPSAWEDGPKHNGAAFMAYRGCSQQKAAWGDYMRLLVGIIVGCALTVGGAYIADTISAAGAKPVMVNWDVVAKNLDSVTTLARAGWKKIVG
jgi:hypothetical protein